jgi:uncharacterized membrane protein
METTDKAPFALALVAALGCGVMAGVFFAFSTSIMRALGNIAPSQGIATMQSINIVIINPVFMLAFMGTAAICVLSMILAVLRLDGPSRTLILAGGAIYLLGSIGVTALANVPMNDALATLMPTAPDSASRWATYLTNWTAWNHVRTVASLVAAALFTIALMI